MTARYRGRVIHAVWQAKKRDRVLHVRATAKRIAEAAGSPQLLEAVADELLREGVRQRANMYIDHSSRLRARAFPTYTNSYAALAR